MVFETSQRLDKWVEKHRKKCKTRATAGEQFVWEFLPSGIIEMSNCKMYVLWCRIY